MNTDARPRRNADRDTDMHPDIITNISAGICSIFVGQNTFLGIHAHIWPNFWVYNWACIKAHIRDLIFESKTVSNES